MNTKASSGLPTKQAPVSQPSPASRNGPRLDKIFICGDPHGKFDYIVQAISQYRPDAIVILGDLTPSASLDEIFKDAGQTQIYWIPGNHDTDSDLIYDRIWRSKYAKNNLHGKVLDVAGVKIAGLGGVFRGQIWMPESLPIHYSPGQYLRKVGKGMSWRGGLPRRHRSTIFCSVYDRLMEQKADVLVTHEAPSAHEKGFICIDRLGAALGVRQLFHAHQHESKRYGLIKGVGTWGIGLRGIVNLAGEIIYPAEADLRPMRPTILHLVSTRRSNINLRIPLQDSEGYLKTRIEGKVGKSIFIGEKRNGVSPYFGLTPIYVAHPTNGKGKLVGLRSFYGRDLI